MLPKSGLTVFSYAAVKSDMPAEMANIERDALALVHAAALASAVGMLLEPGIAVSTRLDGCFVSGNTRVRARARICH